MELNCTDLTRWKQALSSYKSSINTLSSTTKTKQHLTTLDEFYTTQLPSLITKRNPQPFITTSELSQLMQWKLSRGKWRPRLLDFVSKLDEEVVKSASQKAFESVPDLRKAVSELTVLKGVGAATASAVLAAYAPDVAPFMSDEAMVAVFGHSKDYSLKQYLEFASKLQYKAKELSSDDECFTPSDVERALWSSAIENKLAMRSDSPPKENVHKNSKRKR